MSLYTSRRLSIKGMRENEVFVRNSSGRKRLFIKHANKLYSTALYSNTKEDRVIKLIRNDLRVTGPLKVGSEGYLTLTDNEIDVSSGNLVLDVAGDISLNADGGEVIVGDGVTTVAQFSSASSISKLSLFSQADSGDLFKIETTTHGATTMTTTDDDAVAAHLTLDIDGNFFVNKTGTQLATVGNASNISVIELYSNQDTGDKLSIATTTHGATTISTTDDDGTAANLTLQPDGDLELGPAGGDITFKDSSSTLGTVNGDGLTVNNISEVGSDTDKFIMSDSGLLKYATGANLRSYIGAGTGDMTSFQLEDGDGTEVAVSNAKEVKFVEGSNIDINWTDTDNGTDGDPYDMTFSVTLPFVVHSCFQDDLGTSRVYIPLNDTYEQAFAGTEQALQVSAFDMTLQKVAMRSSTDLSGATLTLGMFAIDSGTTDGHHHTTGKNWVAVTGGAQHTNCTWDFTGTVGDGTNASGGSNAVEKGQLFGFQIQSDTDVTDSNSEFWFTFLFHADMSDTI